MLDHLCRTFGTVHQRRAGSYLDWSVDCCVITRQTVLHPSILCSREWAAVVLKLDDTLRSLSRHIMDSILISQPIRSLDSVIHMPPPIVLVHTDKTSQPNPFSSTLVFNGTYFPRAALIPPCAATVWDRVGNSLLMHAVLKPASARPKAALRPAPPAPTTKASYSWSMMG
jgi:hypothetical protein